MKRTRSVNLNLNGVNKKGVGKDVCDSKYCVIREDECVILLFIRKISNGYKKYF